MSAVRTLLDRLALRWHLVLITIGGILFAIYAGLSAGAGNYSKIYLVIFGGLGTAIVLALGRKYWYLLPLGFSLNVPAIPLGGRSIELPELAVMGCTAVFFARRALKLQPVNIFRLNHVPVMLYVAWAAFIFFHNPVGLSSMGAAAGGARFYIRLLLALAAFVIMASQTITDRDCKWILTLMVVGAAFTLFQSLFLHVVLGRSYGDPNIGAMSEEGLSYTWHQDLAPLPVLLVLLLFSRYRTSEIFSLQKLWRPLLLLCCIPLVLWSGKRAAFATMLVYPVLSSIIRKEFGYVFLWLGGTIVAGTLLVAGQGTLFELPMTVQRALSWLPGKWDPEFESMKGGTDQFRFMLRVLASEKVQAYPWIGTGYEIDIALLGRLRELPPDTWEAAVIGHALASNWHNTWLGYAADFGIPASVIAGLIFIHIIALAWWAFTHAPTDSMIKVFALFILMQTIRNLLFAQTSGHSSLDAFDRWWQYGALMSIVASLLASKGYTQTDGVPRQQPAGRSVAGSPTPAALASVRRVAAR